jgi:3D-(3,5/4)-trihydroxycyclohexane-1,2-dione acylhydrolase (decyclizing)
LIIAGGGLIYSEASAALAAFVESTGIAVAETQAGKGALPHDHAQNIGAIGVTGGSAANAIARDADAVIAIGTRLTDFTTASMTAFQCPNVRFININVSTFDARKNNALGVVGDARVAIEELSNLLGDYSTSAEYRSRVEKLRTEWTKEVDRLRGVRHGPPLSQIEVIAAVNDAARPQDVVVGAAGSLPGDLHKLWRTCDPKGYHVEYGYSCMGYEIAGGLGLKMAGPERDVFVMVGDGSYLMMSSEIVTSIQEGIKLNIVLLDSHGFASIGGLSKSLGSGGFGTEYRHRTASGHLDGTPIEIDYAAGAAALGARATRVTTHDGLRGALEKARAADRTTVIVVEVDPEAHVPSYDSWWDVPVAEVSTMPTVQEARAEYEEQRRKERDFS